MSSGSMLAARTPSHKGHFARKQHHGICHASQTADLGADAGHATESYADVCLKQKPLPSFGGWTVNSSETTVDPRDQRKHPRHGRGAKL